MSSFTNLISLNNEAFRTYVFWSAVLVIKMMTMSVLTGRQRHNKNVFANPEDIKDQKIKPIFGDPDVERVRRAHRNDLENILPFLTIGFLYLLTSPPTYLAVNLFRAVAISRFVHSIVYAIFPLPQPARALSWFIGYATTWFMAAQTALFFW